MVLVIIYIDQKDTSFVNLKRHAMSVPCIHLEIRRALP